MRRNALLPLLKFPACIGMLLIGFLPAAAVAQDTTVVPIAARVRLHPAPDATVSAMRDGERVQLGFGRATVLNGVVAASPLDSMSLRTDSATYTFAISDVERLELWVAGIPRSGKVC